MSNVASESNCVPCQAECKMSFTCTEVANGHFIWWKYIVHTTRFEIAFCHWLYSLEKERERERERENSKGPLSLKEPNVMNECVWVDVLVLKRFALFLFLRWPSCEKGERKIRLVIFVQWKWSCHEEMMAVISVTIYCKCRYYYMMEKWLLGNSGRGGKSE